MTRRDRIDHDAEALVRDVLATAFHQTLSDAQVAAVAKKVSAAVPEPLVPPQPLLG